MSFESFGLDGRLLRALEDLNFTEPTPIQRDAIPPAMQGRDVLACAATGSGKTAAFLLPILNQLAVKPRGVTRALILTPTRELAAQIEEMLRDLARHTRLTGAAVFGGVGMGPQERAFRTGADVIVATPGRLLDHFRQPYARLQGLEHLVLDEADRMLDMGFLPDIRRVMAHLPRQRQTLFFSATVPPPIQTLARELLNKPVTLNIERQAAPAARITHLVYPVAAQTEKAALLVHLLQDEGIESAVVFTRTKHRANRLADFLGKHGIECARIHGNRSQSQRTQALAGFKDGKFRVLVATDIAQRGIDVTDLSHVINFDVPNVAEDYIHRVGRTARMEASGDAITFVSPEEADDLRAIEKAIGSRLPRREAPAFERPQPVRTAAMSEPRPAAPSRPASKPRPASRPAGAQPAGVSKPRPAGDRSWGRRSGRGGRGAMTLASR